jgi:glycerol-1-phosphate dehydrogenase [NAD(P)+]
LIIDKPALHGEQCGVGTIMMAKLHGLDWIKIKDSLMTIGAPTTAEGLGIKREKIIEALTMAQKVRPERYTILSKIKLDRVSAEALATETGVI